MKRLKMSREILSNAKRKIYELTSKLPVVFKLPIAMVWLLIVYIIAMVWDFALMLRYAIKEIFRKRMDN